MLPNMMRQVAATMCKRSTFLSQVRHKAAYEGDGKMTVRVINKELDLGLMIDTYATFGFKLNNGITVLGPMAIFPRSVLSWQVAGADEITPESLRLFKLLEPKIDLLIVGMEYANRSVATQIHRMAQEMKLTIEVLPTEHACSTFNFLNAEGRCVAAALIPPLSVAMNEDDYMRTSTHYRNVFKEQV